MIPIPINKQLIVFDGICNLCNSSITYVINRDKKDRFLFAPLQGKTGQDLMSKFNINTLGTDSILLYNPKKNMIYTKSTAALKISFLLGFPTNLLSLFLILPAFLRDFIYDYIAKNRYKWFGKKEACMVPNKALKKRFLE